MRKLLKSPPPLINRAGALGTVVGGNYGQAHPTRCCAVSVHYQAEITCRVGSPFQFGCLDGTRSSLRGACGLSRMEVRRSRGKQNCP